MDQYSLNVGRITMGGIYADSPKTHWEVGSIASEKHIYLSVNEKKTLFLVSHV